jgi:hypothetical protein
LEVAELEVVIFQELIQRVLNQPVELEVAEMELLALVVYQEHQHLS